MPFKVGDIVRWLGKHEGIIRYVDHDLTYAVEFSNSFIGHNCMGHVSSHHGRWITGDDDLELISKGTSKTKQELIIDKIKYLDKKFEERNKSHDYQTSTV